MGPLTTALALVALHHANALPAADLADGTRWLRAHQRDDGSFVARPFAPAGDTCATAACWAALGLSSDPADVAAAARARAYVDEHGGIEKVVAAAATGDIAGAVLRMAGHDLGASLPGLPLPVLLVPQLIEQISRRVTFYGLTAMIAVALIDRGPLDEAQLGLVKSVVAKRAHARALELLTLYQNRNGSLMNVVFHTALLVGAMIAAGVPRTEPRLATAIAWLRARGARDGDGLYFDVYGSDVWSTASYVRTLLLAGASPASAPMQRAITWLLDEQCKRPHPKLTNPTPGAPRTGGWGFQSGEDAYPDCDTTSTVLDALGRALLEATGGGLPQPLAARTVAAIASARAWLLAMQNPDGGWASFFWGHPSKPPGPIMAKPMAVPFATLPRTDPMAWVRAFAELTEHLADSATEDVTSRVLLALARTGSTLHEPSTQRALEFLFRQQCPFGAWWGRWKVNYLPVTSGVVVAMAAIGQDLDGDAARMAVEWMVAHQNGDGGFGETIDSYRDPSMAGRGPSLAPVTGSVLLGLVDAGARGAAAADRAADYLVATQREDGAWDNGDAVATLVPPNLFYVYGGSAKYIPLEALARYRARA